MSNYITRNLVSKGLPVSEWPDDAVLYGLGGSYDSVSKSDKRISRISKRKTLNRSLADYISSSPRRYTVEEVKKISRSDELKGSRRLIDTGGPDPAQRSAYYGNLEALEGYFNPDKLYEYFPHHPLLLLSNKTFEISKKTPSKRTKKQTSFQDQELEDAQKSLIKTGLDALSKSFIRYLKRDNPDKTLITNFLLLLKNHNKQVDFLNQLISNETKESDPQNSALYKLIKILKTKNLVNLFYDISAQNSPLITLSKSAAAGSINSALSLAFLLKDCPIEKNDLMFFINQYGLLNYLYIALFKDNQVCVEPFVNLTRLMAEHSEIKILTKLSSYFKSYFGELVQEISKNDQKAIADALIGLMDVLSENNHLDPLFGIYAISHTVFGLLLKGVQDGNPNCSKVLQKIIQIFEDEKKISCLKNRNPIDFLCSTSYTLSTGLNEGKESCQEPFLLLVKNLKNQYLRSNKPKDISSMNKIFNRALSNLVEGLENKKLICQKPLVEFLIMLKSLDFELPEATIISINALGNKEINNVIQDWIDLH